MKRILGTAEDYRMLYGRGEGTPRVTRAGPTSTSKAPAKKPTVKKKVPAKKKAPARPSSTRRR